MSNDNFYWITEPQGGKIWFPNSEGRVIVAEAFSKNKNPNETLNYYLMKKEGEEWVSLNINTYSSIVDYTIFDKFKNNAIYFKAVSADTEDAIFGTVSSRTASVENEQIYVYPILEETLPDTYYMLYTPPTWDYGAIDEKIDYFYFNEDNSEYNKINLTNILSEIQRETGTRPVTFLSAPLFARLYWMKQICKHQGVCTLTEPGFYKIVADDGNDTLESDIIIAIAPQEVDIEDLSFYNAIIYSEGAEDFGNCYRLNFVEINEEKFPISFSEVDKENLLKEKIIDVSIDASLYPYCNITCQWFKDGAPIEDATNPYYTAKEVGDYTLQVTSEINGATAVSMSNAARIVSYPHVPEVVAMPEGATKISNPLTIQLSEDIATDGFRFAWKKMIISPSETSFEDNISSNDIHCWKKGHLSIVPEKTTEFINNFYPNMGTGFYYCEIYNELQEVLSEPLKLGPFEVVSE